MVNLHHIHFLAKEIARAGRAQCDGQRPPPSSLRVGVTNAEIEARGLPVKMVELEFCDELGNEFTELVPAPTGDPLDIFTATLQRLTALAKQYLAIAISTVLTIAKLIFEVESKQADSLPPPKTIGNLKRRIPQTLTNRLIPTPILRAHSAH